MTIKEKKIYIQWLKEMAVKGDLKDVYFKRMQKLCEEHSGKKATCSLEANLAYLLSSEDRKIRDQALTTYKQYWEASGQYDALIQLESSFANIK